MQHVLFAVDLNGKVDEKSLLKHTGEDWEFNAPFLYKYAGHSLDDGLRYSVPL